MGPGLNLPTMADEIDDGWISCWVRRLVSGVLKHLDRLPRHVGIVMDGNRRYARIHGQSRKDGHTRGFKTMSRLLAVAYAAKIPEITVYAFSIENFNRSPEEVEDLMDIARTRLRQLAAHKGIAQEYGVQINILGRIDLLPQDIQDLAHDLMNATAQNNQAKLNLAMPYTARDDMAHGIAVLASNAHPKSQSHPGKHSHPPSPEFVESDLSNAMYTAHTLPLDLLIRTSDTYRLSDFLLWEINPATVIEFVPDLWPEYTPVKFLKSVLRWRSLVA